MYRILELLRLEMTFKIIMLTMLTTKPCPQSAESTGFVEEFQG